MTFPITGPCSIDVVVDHHAGVLRGGSGPATVELLPATAELLREAGHLHIPLRLALPEMLADAAIPELEPLLALVEAVTPLDALELPEGPGAHVLVAADRVVRRAAAAEGWLPVPHPRLALPAALGERLLFAHLTGVLSELQPPIGIVPYWIERRAGRRATAFALLTRQALGGAIDAGFVVERLPLGAEVEDPALVVPDDGNGAALGGGEVLWSDGSRLLVALGGDDLPAGSRDGRVRLLAPSPELLRPPLLVAATAPEAVRPAALPPALTAESLAADAARHAGADDRARALLEDLAAAGLEPSTHDIAYGGTMRHSVVAGVDGAGEVGLDAGVLVVGCRLDGPDAAGIATLLALARHLAAVRGELHHSVWLCSFAAEAAGFTGSRAYAAMLKATSTPVAGVVCCDGLGFNRDGARTFAVHAGHTDRDVRDLSVPLAELVARSARAFGLPAPVEVHRGLIAGAGDDPRRYDPAIGRGSHDAFHDQGYPAVLLSGDGFPAPAPRDAPVDADYVADLASTLIIAVTALAAS